MHGTRCIDHCVHVLVWEHELWCVYGALYATHRDSMVQPPAGSPRQDARVTTADSSYSLVIKILYWSGPGAPHILPM